MATLWNQRKLGAVSRDTQESAENGQSENAFDPPVMTEDYITQVSQEIEEGSLKSCLWNLVGWSHVFLVLCQNFMNFS